MNFGLERKEKILLAVIMIISAILLIAGWRIFWFISDDAFISFRYISNSMLGYGYVWNPPPFRPVEGYTNFLWMVLLELIWRVFGVEPPVSVNYISLAFTFLALVLAALFCLRMKWSGQLRSYRVYLVGLMMAWLIANRTILAWSSSGLETAFFNFLFILWIYLVLFGKIEDGWRGAQIILAAVAIYLTRPDGILILVASFAILLEVRLRKGPALSEKLMLSASPAVIVLLHLIWRRTKYGEWLPNTYYAKYTGIWPESGIRYLFSFILEYALWIWIAAGVWLVIKRIRERKLAGETPSPKWRYRSYKLHIVIAALVVHTLYYTLVIGGDHFEYRVYSHLLYLIVISFIWMLNSLEIRKTAALVLMTVFLLFSLPVPWSHWAHTRDLDTREQTHKLRANLHQRWPEPLDRYVKLFDDMQHWLIDHYVCVRHQEHKINYEFIESIFPSRKRGLSIAPEGYPVFPFPAVGLASWVLPHVNIIDLHGLNDYVIARNPRSVSSFRMMAHDRTAPEGYIRGFLPNVRLRSGG
ncbi:MAG: hypothetical protein GF417_05990, partial [Candidatus Latescibacteria bacterium]|nr:hypothetical protein [bacterium]MBD3423968.1 hypothetical protein [Candidatus Latescibacterota bacterium]